MSDQRGGLFEALSADAQVVALDVINAGKPLGHIPVQVVDVAANDNGQQVVATADGDYRGGNFINGSW
jgi:hypothetical protein